MAVTIQRYDSFPQKVLNGDINVTTDSIYVALMTSAHSYTATHSIWTQINSNQIANGNGYTRVDGGTSGRALSSITLTSTAASTLTWDAGDSLWSAAGGSIAAEHAVLVDATASGDPLMWNINFGVTETAGDGTTFKITWNASGIFTVT